ncbi:MAG: efflux RND transporter periplasmic adaptor subunit [Gemmatimonadaceae bacterium]|nr:efflux RND transporter periplasmic adaptor subunit [Gemmatimonadaceae bacterium]MCW5827201.1 efflux RND transporter periplasmic adaptor subunit [Gemmatimonadaceae bacterium]
MRRLSLILLAAAALGACDKLKSSDAATDAAAEDGSTASDSAGSSGGSTVSLPVVATEVTDGDLVLSINTTGQVRSESEGRIRTEVAGTVARVLVRPGDRVRRGQPIVELDARPFEIDLAEAEVALREATQRYEDLYRPDSAATGVMPSQVRLDAFVIRSGLAAARVRLDRAKLARERSTIYAPFNGTVDRISTVVGDRVNAGQDLAALVDLESLRIEAAVLEHDLPLIRVGGEAVITSAAVPGQAIPGRVSAILPMVDSTTRAGRAFVRASGGSALRPGMYADVRLEAQRLSNRRLVPARAIIERDGRPLVFVVRGGRAQWTYVLPGRSNGQVTEILPDSSSGIIPVNPGDQVIIEGHLTLTHDAPVRAVAPRERNP